MINWRLRVLDGSGLERCVHVTGEPEAPFAELLAAFAAKGYATGGPRVNGTAVPADATPASIGLTHGSTVEFDTDRHGVPSRAPGFYLVAVSGPQAGSWWAIPAGRALLVGREAPADVVIRDVLVSGRHLSLSTVEDGRIRVEELGSSNGTKLEGEVFTGETLIRPGTYLQVGATVLTVLTISADELPVEAPVSDGSRPFQRHFRPALEPLPERLLPPEPPDARESAGSRTWWQYLLPMATGVGFAVITGRWIFLLLMAVSPIALVGNYFYRRRRDARKEAERAAGHEADLAAYHERLAQVQVRERDRRRRAAVVGGEAVLRAEFRHRQLWERVAGDPDHLEVCVGLADQPSLVQTTKQDTTRARLWAVPLSVSLPATGSLLVAGPVDRARAVGRSLLLNLATTHAPHELQVSILTTEDGEADWDWARWLPHAFIEGGGARISSTREQRDIAMTGTRQILDSREDQGPGVAHVVIIDGAQHVDGGWLTRVLSRGAELGIHGIVLDPHIVPEGVRGTLSLGEHQDEGTFVSRDLARTEGILTAELSVGWAQRAARAMAGLRPAVLDDSGVNVPEVHLTDLVEGITQAEHVREEWEQRSPQEQVVVGLAGRTPVNVNIVTQGPHAIVGGMTRSGKTEFLLTWLTVMCLHNSVDDLAIVIADFKGGVDHSHTAKMPHVVSLVTNQDIRAFERTMVMLEAEVKRRQQVLDAAETSTLEAYRTKRMSDASLAAMPRLLVVVDEFSELRKVDREGGTNYLSWLESLARVGAAFGVHLVLATQNFAGGQLSDQIDGQVGLRVCFRVNDSDHSKFVLSSAVAATIPEGRPGRAWARFGTTELTEFQCARVAGQRRDLVIAERARVEHVPFGALPYATPRVASGSVEFSETDLATLVDAANTAAGGRRPPIPWPGELDVTRTLADLIAGTRNETVQAVAIGTTDVPERQEQRPALLHATDEQVLVVGGVSTDLSEILLTMAASEALHHRPDQLHLYGIDLESTTLRALRALPHTGGVACLDDDLAGRIIRRLTEEVGRRRSAFGAEGVDRLADYVRVTGHQLPRIRLLVRSVERLLPTRDQQHAHPLLAPLTALTADASDTGVGIVLAGNLSAAGKGLTNRVTRRLVARFPSPDAYASLGVPRSKVVELARPRRLWDATDGHLLQIAAVGNEEASTAEVVDALGTSLREHHADDQASWPQPLTEVRWPLPWDRLDTRSLAPPVGFGRALPIGVDTETSRWTWLDADEDGPLIAIGGESRSGRSSTLLALALIARQLGWQVIGVSPTRRSPLWQLGNCGVEVVSGLSAVGVPAPGTLVLVDDANRLEGEPTLLTSVLHDPAPGIFVAVAAPPGVFARPLGVFAGLREVRVGLTLAPSGSTGTANVALPQHLRVDPKPGRGVLVNAGEFVSIQVPLVGPDHLAHTAAS